MTNENISINPNKIKIDEAGRVILEDTVLAEALVRVKDLNIDGTLSCDLNIGTCVPVKDPNVGSCGNSNGNCGKIEDIEISNKFIDLIKVDDIIPFNDLDDIREHIFRDRNSGGGSIIDRPL